MNKLAPWIPGVAVALIAGGAIYGTLQKSASSTEATAKENRVEISMVRDKVSAVEGDIKAIQTSIKNLEDNYKLRDADIVSKLDTLLGRSQ